MIRTVLMLILTAAAVVSVSAQGTGPDCAALVAQVNAGNGDAVREQLPSLLSQYPNDPGVLYLQALLTREGADAVRTYQSIVDNFPRSEWADDALYRVYQFYYALGLYRTAELKMNQLKSAYPASPYATGQEAATAQAVPMEQPAGTVPAGSGTASVPPVVPPPATPAEQPAERAVQNQVEQPADPAPMPADHAVPVRFSLQVGAFTVHANAAAQKARFEAMGYPAEMLSKVRDTRSLFIVMIGNYATYDEAKAAAAALKRSSGLDAMVISR